MPRKRKPVELPTPLLLSKPQTAHVLGISERAVEYLANAGKLEKRMFGTAVRYTFESVKALAATGVPRLEKPPKAEEEKLQEPTAVETPALPKPAVPTIEAKPKPKRRPRAVERSR